MDEDGGFRKAVLVMYVVGIVIIAFGVYVSKVGNLGLMGIGIILVGALMFVLPMTRKRYV